MDNHNPNNENMMNDCNSPNDNDEQEYESEEEPTETLSLNDEIDSILKEDIQEKQESYQEFTNDCKNTIITINDNDSDDKKQPEKQETDTERNLRISTTIHNIQKHLNLQSNSQCERCSQYGHKVNQCKVNTALYCNSCHHYGHSTYKCGMKCRYCFKFGHCVNNCHLMKNNHQKHR